MADKTVTVGNGKTYADLKTALATEFTNNPNLTTNNGTGGAGKITFECYNLSGGTGESVTATSDLDTTVFTTDVNNYVILKAAASEITAANRGKWAADRYRILPSLNLNAAVTLGNYAQAEDLQIWCDVNAASATAVYGFYCTGNNTLRRCILRCDVGASANSQNYVGYGLGASSGTHTFINCIAYDFYKSDEPTRGRGFSFDQTGVTSNAYNCTTYNCQFGFSSGAGTANWRNCGAAASGNVGFNGGTQTTCSSSTPTFVDATGRDLHLASGDTTWKNQGTDYSGVFTTDIDGQTRPTGAGTWDIGADEELGATASLSPSVSVSPSISPSIAPEDAVCWGDQGPHTGQECVTWQRFEKSAGVKLSTSGDPDWGAAAVSEGTPIYSDVKDTGDANPKMFSVTPNNYAAGDTPTISIRGSASAFAQHDATPTWDAYSAPVQQSWRYVQIKLEA